MRVNPLRKLWVTFSIYIVGFYASVLNRFEIRGSENIPHSGPVIIASNHISAYETVFIPWAVIRNNPFQMLWVPAKEELFEKPLQRLVYSSWGAFPVKRKRDMKAGLILNNLLIDQKVMLFPEGTRHKDGRLGKGNRGVGKIIYDTRPIVIPTALVGLNRWKVLCLGQRAAVIFGKPLNFKELFLQENCKETHNLIVTQVMQAIADLLKQEGAHAGEA